MKLSGRDGHGFLFIRRGGVLPGFQAADTDQQEALFLQGELVTCLDKGVGFVGYQIRHE
ncbi:hypothetical protein NGUA22_04572 [Salmonella enterica]|nr:hypothetical protein NGUA22_04572 [Salmonella enterica]